MQNGKKLSLRDMEGDFIIYFNWSANALYPLRPGSADIFLKQNKTIILKVAHYLLTEIGYIPEPIYRGILLKQPVNSIIPLKNLQYLSFSTDRSIAEYFADVNGFGSEIMNNAAVLGKYGYVIEYTPTFSEILFHHSFLSLLPYAESFSLLGMNGILEVEGLKKQQEVIILQPSEAFTNITGSQKQSLE